MNRADYGTNGGTALSRAATEPSRSDTVVVSTIAYNSRDEACQVTDPDGAVNQSTFATSSGQDCGIDGFHFVWQSENQECGSEST